MVVVAGDTSLTHERKGLYLYHAGTSCASQKVRACLEEKGLDWSGKVVTLTEDRDWYYKVNPKGLVPALVHDGITHIESNDIMVYLDETFPTKPLRPDNIDGMQQVKYWMDLEGSIQKSIKYITFAFMYGPTVSKFMVTDRKLEKVKTQCPEDFEFYQQCREGFSEELLHLHIEKLHEVFQILDTRLNSQQWLVGDSLSLADLCWGPSVFHSILQFDFPMGRYRGVQNWYKRLCDTSTGFQDGVLSNKWQPASVAYRAMKSFRGVKRFFGYSISCFEKETDTNGWWSVLIMSLLLAMCLIFYPKDGISIQDYSVSRLVAILSMSFLCLWKLRSSYNMAHTRTRLVYHSRKHNMKAMLTHEYGADVQMKLADYPRPKVLLPDDVLIRVKAVSINPLDVKMKQGYGKDFFNLMRRMVLKDSAHDGQPLPVILGRDFSGIVEQVGASVRKVLPGDGVWGGAYPSQTSGTLAEYVVTKEKYISKKPKNVSHNEAASIGYVAMTTRTALSKGNMNPDNSVGKRVLILGGTGGIGTFAIQLVKAWGGHVTTTCSSRGVELVKRLGADEVVDYTKEDFETVLHDKQRFDVVLDTRGPASFQACLNLCKAGGSVLTLVSPLFVTLDKYGLWLGLFKAGYDFIKVALPQKILHGRNFKYVMVEPSGEQLDEIGDLVQDNKIEAIIEKTFPLSQANEALEYVAKGHTHGKVVVTVE